MFTFQRLALKLMKHQGSQQITRDKSKHNSYAHFMEMSVIDLFLWEQDSCLKAVVGATYSG